MAINMKKIPTLSLIALFCFISVAYGLTPADLTYMAEDYPPANFIEEGEIKGASVELLKLIWERMGSPEQPIKIVPWARGYKLAQTEPHHVLFSMSRTDVREKLFKWVGPIFKARHILVGMRDTNKKIDSLEDAKAYKIGTIRDDIGELTLLRNGFDEEDLERVSKLEQNVRKLIRGRVDFICQSEDSVRDFIAMNGIDPNLFKTFLVVNVLENYYAFHVDTPDSLIQKFQTALDSLENQRLRILERYGMTP